MDSLVSQHDVDGGQAALCALLSFSAVTVSALILSVDHETYNIFIGALYPLEALSIFVQLSTKVLESLERLLLFRLYGLLLCKLAIVVDCA